MTRKEFNIWLEDFGRRFPGTMSWLEGLPDTNGTLNEWYDTAFSRISYSHALAISREIHEGIADLGQWQAIPATYLTMCEAIAFAEANADLQAEMPQTDGRRISCPICRDAGLVLCWHTESMKEARAIVLNRPDIATTIKYRECGVACTCVAGNKFGRVKRTRRVKGKREVYFEDRCRFDPAKWITIVGDQEKDFGRLRAWAEAFS